MSTIPQFQKFRDFKNNIIRTGNEFIRTHSINKIDDLLELVTKLYEYIEQGQANVELPLTRGLMMDCMEISNKIFDELNNITNEVLIEKINEFVRKFEECYDLYMDKVARYFASLPNQEGGKRKKRKQTRKRKAHHRKRQTRKRRA